MSGSAVQDAASTSVGPEFFYPDLPIDRLQPSPLNPRKTFTEAAIDQLATSLLSVGILEPLVVRPVGDHYEIVAGERRYRAALKAQLATVPASVRPLTDDQALEIMVIENLQREDINALEEGDGFARLLQAGYGLEKLVARIGMSKKYIYDRIKLGALIPAGQQFLTEGRITAGHAILLARLTPQDQARAIDPMDGGLFYFNADLESEPTPEGLNVTVSVREFDGWIERHVRLDLSKPVASEEFPEAAQAQETAARVVSITHARYLDARQQEGAAAGDQVLLASEWKRADGATLLDVFQNRQVTHPGCEKSLLGVVVIGLDRGTAFQVCVERSCDVHWSKKERVEAQRRETDDASSGADGTDGREEEQQRRGKAEQRFKAEQDRSTAERAAYRVGAPAILAAFVARVKAAKIPVLADAIERGAAFHPKAIAAFPHAKTADDLLRVIALSFVAEGLFNEWSAPQQVPLWAKRFGLDLKPLLKPAKTAVHASAQKTAATRKIAPQPKPKAAKKKR